MGIRSDPEVYRYFKHPHRLTVEEHEKWYREIYLQDDNMIHWICEKDGVSIGVFAVVRMPGSEAELSYLVAEKYQRNGYAKEALKAIILWIMREWQSERIFAEIHQDNAASKTFIKSLGFYETNGEQNFLKYIKDFVR